MQAGAFARSEDAEQQRAKLAMLGIESKLTEREQSGRTVYRVRVGPFDHKAEADAAKDKPRRRRRRRGAGARAALIDAARAFAPEGTTMLPPSDATRLFGRALPGAALAGLAGARAWRSRRCRRGHRTTSGSPSRRRCPPPGKIEVIEFFWYECPHCNAFEPALDAWAKQLPADVAFRRVPVWFREEPFTAQQRLYYAIEALGLVPTLHRRVYYAIHNEHMRLRTPEDIAAFVTKNGVDPVKFMAAYSSFSVQARAQQARQLAAAYKIDAVPAMGVQGRYYTNGSLANASGTAAIAGRVERAHARRRRRPDRQGPPGRLRRADAGPARDDFRQRIRAGATATAPRVE